LWPRRRAVPILKKIGIARKIMKTLLKIVIFILAVPVAVITTWLAIWALSLHFETEAKIAASLEKSFPGAEVSINERVDYDPANEICFDLTVRPRSPGPAKREIVMVGGDSDGGTWPLSRSRFRSLQDCKKSFSRG
jgi:hypothetical protein